MRTKGAHMWKKLVSRIGGKQVKIVLVAEVESQQLVTFEVTWQKFRASLEGLRAIYKQGYL